MDSAHQPEPGLLRKRRAATSVMEFKEMLASTGPKTAAAISSSQCSGQSVAVPESARAGRRPSVSSIDFDSEAWLVEPGARGDVADKVEVVRSDSLSPKGLSTQCPRVPATTRWFAGSLWKLNSSSGGCDPADLLSWRRRFFMISWSEHIGVTLSYFSEKENCKPHLALVLRWKDSEARAQISRCDPIEVSLLEGQGDSFAAGCEQYDLAVHRRKDRRDPAREISLPSRLHRLVIDGADDAGNPRRLELGVGDECVLAGWLMILEAVVCHKLEEGIAM